MNAISSLKKLRGKEIEERAEEEKKKGLKKSTYNTEERSLIRWACVLITILLLNFVLDVSQSG